jgi:hypothetical protein
MTDAMIATVLLIGLPAIALLLMTITIWRR